MGNCASPFPSFALSALQPLRRLCGVVRHLPKGERDNMVWLVWGGAALTILGLVGVLLSVYFVVSARRAGLSDEALREKLSRILPLNIGALFLAVLGLMTVIVGVFLA